MRLDRFRYAVTSHLGGRHMCGMVDMPLHAPPKRGFHGWIETPEACDDLTLGPVERAASYKRVKPGGVRAFDPRRCRDVFELCSAAGSWLDSRSREELETELAYRSAQSR